MNDLLPDIYYSEEYAKSTEYLLEGKSESFLYEDENGKILNVFLKRKIDLEGVELDKDYYDIQTPYGYGGPIILSLEKDKDQLLKSYMENFAKYCQDNNIVSEFVRYHPLLDNQKDFSKLYDNVYMRKTVATVLKDKDDAFTQEFSKSTRKLVRKILKEDIEYEIIENPSDLDKFIEIYYDTMDRNDASDYYYFDREYFEFLIKNMKNHIININIYMDEKCIASGLYFRYKDMLHAHLSGTDHNYLHLSPAYILKYLTLKWGEENGINYIHYGGGTTNDENDSLLKFKSKFTKEGFFDFYIGKKIYNQEVYDYLVEQTNTEKEEFFPQYRG